MACGQKIDALEKSEFVAAIDPSESAAEKLKDQRLDVPSLKT